MRTIVGWGERSEPHTHELKDFGIIVQFGISVPNGILSPSPGLPRSGYPGNRNKRGPTPKGLRPQGRWDAIPSG